MLADVTVTSSAGAAPTSLAYPVTLVVQSLRGADRVLVGLPRTPTIIRRLQLLDYADPTEGQRLGRRDNGHEDRSR
jgi:hypothetical protein